MDNTSAKEVQTANCCPLCGTGLPRVVDAFCPYCRESLDDASASEERSFNVPAHLRRNGPFLAAFYLLAVLEGIRAAFFWPSTPIYLLQVVLLFLVMTWWTITDAARRGKPIPLTATAWIFMFA